MRSVAGGVGRASVNHPSAFCLNFGSGIVFARNEQRGDLEPNVRLMLEVLERLEHGSELARTEILVKTFGEGFEVDVGRVHVPKKLDPRLRRDIACAHCHRLDPRSRQACATSTAYSRKITRSL